MNKTFLTIDNEADLIKFCGQLSDSKWLAVDTEFERVQTYYPELCLIQIANSEVAAIIDPIAIANLEPFFELLYKKSITKVFHSAHQDLEIFFHLKGEVPAPIFDTQIAAPLLGYAEQIGYAKLVQQTSGVELGKAYTRSDWKARPLKKGQLEYAINDVIYLGRIYVDFVAKLETLNRTSWLEKDFSALEEIERYEPDPAQIWKKIRESKKLKGEKLAVLQKLAAWRELTARKENKPRNWLLKDEAIVDMAQHLPDEKNALSGIRNLHDRFIAKHGEELLAIIDDARDVSPIPLTSINKRDKLSADQEAIVDALSAIVRLQAQLHDLNPAVLAPRKELESFVLNPDDSILLDGWRGPMIGAALNDFMHGEQCLHLQNGKLSIVKELKPISHGTDSAN